MNRRTFIKLLGGIATPWPWALPTRAQPARAQGGAMPVIGFMHSAARQPMERNIAAFRQALRAAGYVEGENVAFEFRFAENRYERLPELAADLVRRNVAVIVVGGASDGPLAVKRATSTIPIVFLVGGDPIGVGLVESLNPRSGNVTGVTFYSTPLGPKRLELLHELVPAARSIGLLINPNNLNTRFERLHMDAAARSLGLELHVLSASSDSDFDPAFAALAEKRIGGLVVSTEALFNNRIAQLVGRAANHAVPTVYFLRDFVAAGGLASYGASITGAFRQAGDYVGRILKGAPPAELPVLQPTKFELALNLATARSLGVAVPATLLALADEVIE